MNNNVSLFDIGQNTEQISLNNYNTLKPGKLDVVKMEFIEADTLSWSELFDGYDKMYAITYSSGIGFVCELLQKFTYTEIIFGCEEVMTYSLQEVMAY